MSGLVAGPHEVHATPGSSRKPHMDATAIDLALLPYTPLRRGGDNGLTGLAQSYPAGAGAGMMTAAAPTTRQLAAARDRISLLSRQRDALEARVSELSSGRALCTWEKPLPGCFHQLVQRIASPL